MEMEHEMEQFVGKHCSLKFHNDFTLFGVVESVDDAGIIFKTTQKTSFISWNSIKELVAGVY